MGAEKSSSPAVEVVQDQRVAALLVDPVRSTMFWPFLGKARTVTEAAEVTGTGLNTMYVQVQRLLKLGLLRVVGERPRGGRAVKVYRSNADRYFVSYEVMPFETLEALQARRDAPYEGRLRRAVMRARGGVSRHFGYEVARRADGEVDVHPAIGPHERLSSRDPRLPGVMSLWDDELKLSFEDARALQADLYALLERYRQKGGPQPYLLRVGLAPLTLE